MHCAFIRLPPCWRLLLPSPLVYHALNKKHKHYKCIRALLHAARAYNLFAKECFALYAHINILWRTLLGLKILHRTLGILYLLPC